MRVFFFSIFSSSLQIWFCIVVGKGTTLLCSLLILEVNAYRVNLSNFRDEFEVSVCVCLD